MVGKTDISYLLPSKYENILAAEKEIAILISNDKI